MASEIWRGYHESTKHRINSLARAPHLLDWANMPDPFRHYEGVPLLDLPADPPPPGTPALAVLAGSPGHGDAVDGAAFLSQLLFHSAAISASKVVPSTGYRYALRVNPSSGNLHPTEFHFVTTALKEWPDGVYHYRASSHMVEQRAAGHLPVEFSGRPDSALFFLTSIRWREAWKYGERAYRYCLHDIGHAWQALALAARAIGCETFATGNFADSEIARSLQLNEDESPMLLVSVKGPAIPLSESAPHDLVWFRGQANTLSCEQIGYPLIDAIQAATGQVDGLPNRIAGSSPVSACRGRIQLPFPASSTRGFGETTRARRSALDFQGGQQSISFSSLAALLEAAAQPLSADFAATRFVQLYLYIHRVEDLAPGVYRFWPASGTLELLKTGDQRVMAAGLSLGQQLAGSSCVTFSMIGDLERATALHGNRGYRYAHFEAGAVGQHLYLAATALGLGATGIGAFYDDEVHRYLCLKTGDGQVLYHFAIGYSIPDPRLSA